MDVVAALAVERDAAEHDALAIDGAGCAVRDVGEFGGIVRSPLEPGVVPGYSGGMARPIPSLGKRIAPPRFLLFCVVLIAAAVPAIPALGWALGGMAAFDLAGGVFLLACLPLLRNADAAAMRRAALANDANRAMLLGISAVVSLAVLAAVASELGVQGSPGTGIVVLVIATLAIAWAFGNSVYALHYAHLFYLRGADGKDAGGLDFPGTDEPEYWDFVYFAFTLGMTFQTSDTAIRTTRMRKVVTAHSLVAFVFNLGVIAFTINVLGG
jgi:uncharacterized membrane protein